MVRRGFGPLTPGVLPTQTVGETVPIQDSVQLATVIVVTAKGVKFVLHSQPGVSYGPAPWGIGSYSTATTALAAGFAPQVGDSVVVVFAGAGMNTPWVLGWSR